jgi:hypothetical protein
MSEQYQQKPGNGVLFKNNDKLEDGHADYQGNITDMDGNECWLNAWINTSKNGTKYMSVSMRPKKARKTEQAPPRQAAPPRQQTTTSNAYDQHNDGADLEW